MPINLSRLERLLVVVDAEATIERLREQLRDLDLMRVYVVIGLEHGRWAVATPAEVLASWHGVPGRDEHQTRLADLPALLSEHVVEDVDAASMSTPQAERLAQQSRHRRLLVRDGKSIVGILGDRRRSGSGAPLVWPERALSDEVTTTDARVPLAVDPSSTETARRFINVEVTDHDRTQPLEVGVTATLVLDVDVIARIGVATTPLTYEPTPDDGELIELTVDLTSRDVTIHTERQILRLPRTGRSKNRARFDVEPHAQGQLTIDAIIRKDGNWVQHLTLSVAVGIPCPDGVVGVTSSGRPLDAAPQLGPRHATLIVQPRDNGFEAIWCLEAAWRATLPFTVQALAGAVSEARDALRGIVYGAERGRQTSPYLSGLDIPAELDRQTLVRLAEVGYRLFRRLFFDGASEDAQRIGKRLVEAAQRSQLRLQIVSRELVMPWGLLYLADRLDPNHVEPERFLGLKHIVEHLPLEARHTVAHGDIQTRPRLTVSLNVNLDIDREMGVPFTAGQIDYWRRISQASTVDVVVRRTADAVLSDLTNERTQDQIVYFFCHARAGSSDGHAGADDSQLTLTDQTRLALSALKAGSPLGHALPGAPLIFLNACASADLSPLFYDGFAPTLIGLGARGVIGTECDVPAVFADAWARRFFDRWLAGEDLGAVILALRRDLYFSHHNILGLLYAVYCDADTRVAPALAPNSLPA